MSYYEKHRKSMLEKQKKLNAQRQNEIKVYLKSYYSKNKSKLKSRQKKYYVQNKDYYREYMRNYHKRLNKKWALGTEWRWTTRSQAPNIIH